MTREPELQDIEHIEAGNQTLAIIIRGPYKPGRTEFLTPPEYKQQVGTSSTRRAE